MNNKGDKNLAKRESGKENPRVFEDIFTKKNLQRKLYGEGLTPEEKISLNLWSNNHNIATSSAILDILEKYFNSGGLDYVTNGIQQKQSLLSALWLRVAENDEARTRVANIFNNYAESCFPIHYYLWTKATAPTFQNPTVAQVTAHWDSNAENGKIHSIGEIFASQILQTSKDPQKILDLKDALEARGASLEMFHIENLSQPRQDFINNVLIASEILQTSNNPQEILDLKAALETMGLSIEMFRIDNLSQPRQDFINNILYPKQIDGEDGEIWNSGNGQIGDGEDLYDGEDGEGYLNDPKNYHDHQNNPVNNIPPLPNNHSHQNTHNDNTLAYILAGVFGSAALIVGGVLGVRKCLKKNKEKQGGKQTFNQKQQPTINKDSKYEIESTTSQNFYTDQNSNPYNQENITTVKLNQGNFQQQYEEEKSQKKDMQI